MDSKDKKILQLAATFMEKNGCLWGEMDAEGYSYQFYGGRRFQCGTSEKEQGSNMNLPFEIGPILTKILEERSQDIPEESESWDSYGSLSSVSVKIYPKERKVKVYGVYQVSVTLDEQIDDVEMPDAVVTIMNTWDITSGRIDFNGGGDSGYIEESFDGGEQVPAIVQDWCYDQLESLHGGWEINEGSDGSFEFDLRNGIINLNHTMNTEVDKQDTIFEESFGKK